MSIFDPQHKANALTGLLGLGAADLLKQNWLINNAFAPAPPTGRYSAVTVYPPAPISHAERSLMELSGSLDPQPNHLAGLPYGVEPAPPRRRVFISFQAEDRWAVQLLRDVAARPHWSFEIYDESLREPYDSADRRYIEGRLRERIARTSVTVCVVGPTTRWSRYVDFELRESVDKGNRVIGIAAPGLTSVPYPHVFEQMGSPVKLWNLAWLQREIASAPEPATFGTRRR